MVMPFSSLNPGLTHEARYLVTRAMSPPHIEGILATFRMISLIEDTCLAAVQPLLGDGLTTVGTRVDVTHVGTAQAGEEVTVRIRLAKVTQGRLLSFEVDVATAAGVIGTGIHQRLVVDRASFTRS
jgi:fluoroacetyl-CoA thioesterase